MNMVTFSMATDIRTFEELNKLDHINNVPIGTIEDRARARAWSVGGFLSADERLIDVLQKDWDTVSSLGLTHVEIAGHVNKMILKAFGGLGYSENKREISYDFSELNDAKLPSLLTEGASSRLSILVHGYGGFQEDIFKSGEKNSSDGCVVNERNWCRDYVITNLDTGESIKVAYGVIEYIKRYGFYEGSVEYRVDPLRLLTVLTGKDFQSK